MHCDDMMKGKILGLDLQQPVQQFVYGFTRWVTPTRT